jgi:hypothetical protein
VPTVKTGCGCGCLTVISLGLLVAGLLWFGSGIFDRPTPQLELGGPADGRRAQQKLFELTSSGGNRRGEPRAITLSERELNALLARHLSSEQLPLADAGIRLVGDGVVEITGRLPLHALFGDSLSAVTRFLPERWAEKPAWLRLRGHARLETGAARGDRRRLRLDVESMWMGSRRLPAAVLSVLPEGPVLRATRWPVPDSVDSMTVEPGRVTITIRS